MTGDTDPGPGREPDLGCGLGGRRDERDHHDHDVNGEPATPVRAPPGGRGIAWRPHVGRVHPSRVAVIAAYAWSRRSIRESGISHMIPTPA